MMLLVLTLTSASNLVLYFSRFTDETFSALSSVIFMYEATRNLVKPFLQTNPVRTQTKIHLQDHLMGRTLLRWYIHLGLYTHKVGCPSDNY
jgi:hypothetical protein